MLASIDKLDVLINNSGYLSQKNFLKINENDWQKSIDINLKSVFFVTQFCFERMLKKNSAFINTQITDLSYLPFQ